jgi:hypothetical protein
MSCTAPSLYRAAAERCRAQCPVSEDWREWIRYSQEWEKIAEITETLFAHESERAHVETVASAAVIGSASCENPRKTLLLAGTFCARRPDFRCDPLDCPL